MYCSYCGAKIEEDSAFCSFCGKPADNDNDETKNNSVSNELNDEHHEETYKDIDNVSNLTCPENKGEESFKKDNFSIKRYTSNLFICIYIFICLLLSVFLCSKIFSGVGSGSTEETINSVIELDEREINQVLDKYGLPPIKLPRVSKSIALLNKDNDEKTKLITALYSTTAYPYGLEEAVEMGVYKKLSIGEVIFKMFPSPKITYEENESGNLVLTITGNYKCSPSDTNYAMSGSISFCLNSSGKVSCCSDPNRIKEIIESYAVSVGYCY